MALMSRVVNDQTCKDAASRLFDDIALGDLATDNNALRTGPLSLASTVVVNASNVINVEQQQGQLKLRLHGQILELDTAFAAAVEHILQQRTLRVGDIPELSDNQQLALCLQLQASGVLFIDALGNDS
ncbi:MAG: hypothetical protein AAF404_01580 [Pseudomonadota bacterium]